VPYVRLSPKANITLLAGTGDSFGPEEQEIISISTNPVKIMKYLIFGAITILQT
jgi:hypothetical protein